MQRDLTIASAIAGLGVSALIGASLYDFVKTAVAKDEKVQESTLKGELALFLLALRDDDGSSLLDNVSDFASAKRDLGAVAMRKSFYTYFLTQENAKQVAAKGISWEPPKSCALDFIDQSVPTEPRSIRTCFAVVPDEPIGRYIYFSISYPTNGIARHRAGLALNRSSSVLLRLKGENTASVRLMFEEPTLVQKRYPSQLWRFSNVHELTAYSSDQLTAPLRSVKGQAFEKRPEAADAVTGNVVTLLGRIDAQLVFSSQASIDAWAKGRFRDFRASIEVSDLPASGAAVQKQIVVPFGAKGTALQSLEQAYYTFVQSHAKLELFEGLQRARSGPSVWQSPSAAATQEPAGGRFQAFSNRWANTLVKKFDYQRGTVVAEQSILGARPHRATLTAEPVLLPDLAARAFLGLLGALLGIVLIGSLWFFALRQLNVMARGALRSARQPSLAQDMDRYARRRGEIGSLGRTFELLIRRFRSRNATIIRNARRLDAQRQERLRFADEQYKARHDVLRAIGHEIRNPLQSLLTRTGQDPTVRLELEKMGRAVEALYAATSVEAGLKDRRVSAKLADAAEFMQRLAANLRDQGIPIEYHGPAKGVSAVFDNIALDDALGSVLDNAQRFMTPGSTIELDLAQTEVVVHLKIRNVGPQIAEDDLGAIFDFGFSTQLGSEHMGLGLFSARVSVLRMGGTISAANMLDGVMFIIALQRHAPDA
ncbi:HAMP domain-containing sensor histidine kinase [Variovorax sp. YR266]|uniref:sensor histidine kinase n=1 Tax=Variovorax sp. YR266 TaxID=1884386 RepID=UPI0015A0F1FC|nr:HAMP domain-containing sensor histidine kinase [Variovorax sp. YR266]